MPQAVHDLTGGSPGQRRHHPAEVTQIVKMQLWLANCIASGEERHPELALGVEAATDRIRNSRAARVRPVNRAMWSLMTGRRCGGTVTVRLDSVV